jgi:chromosome segregation ATPase
MKKSFLNLKNLILFVTIFAVLASASPETRAQTSSKEGSAKDTVVISKQLLDNANKALDELEVSDRLIASQESELKLLRERLELEKEKAALLGQIAESAKRESESLREANNALREALAAKDEQIKNDQKQIEILKNKKPAVLKRILDVAAGVGIGLILK